MRTFSDSDIISKWLRTRLSFSSMKITRTQIALAKIIVCLINWHRRYPNIPYEVFISEGRKNGLIDEHITSQRILTTLNAIVSEFGYDYKYPYKIIPAGYKTFKLSKPKADKKEVIIKVEPTEDELFRRRNYRAIEKQVKEQYTILEKIRKDRQQYLYEINAEKKAQRELARRTLSFEKALQKVVFEEQHQDTLCQVIPLDPNNKQRTMLKHYMDASRFCYNRLLAIWIEARKDGKIVFVDDVLPNFNKEKRLYSFLNDVPVDVIHDASRRLRSSINHFANKGKKFFPVYHSKKSFHESFCFYGKKNFVIDKATASSGKLKIPSWIGNKQYFKVPLLGNVRMKCKTRFSNQHIKSARVVMDGNNFYVAIKYIINKEEYQKIHNYEHHTDRPVGIDLGIKEAAVLSSGISISAFNISDKENRRLKRYQRAYTKKPSAKAKRETENSIVSENALKAQEKYRKFHQHIVNKRKDYAQKWTTIVVGRYRNIVIENLSVRSMLKKGNVKHCNISNAGMYHIRELLQMKEYLFSGKVTVAERAYPSTRKCSRCGNVVPRAIPVSQRVFICPNCGFTIDRDLNAAINLKNIIGEGISKSTPVDLVLEKSDFPRNGIQISKVKAGRRVKSKDL